MVLVSKQAVDMVTAKKPRAFQKSAVGVSEPPGPSNRNRKKDSLSDVEDTRSATDFRHDQFRQFGRRSEP